MSLFPSKRTLTTAKMAKHGGAGTEEEYRDLLVSRQALNLQAGYSKTLLKDPSLKERAKNYAEEHWWKELGESANNDEFYGVLFEKYMFYKNGGLDWEFPGFRKVVHTLCVAYLHICSKFGEDTLPGWTVHWTKGKDMGPYMKVTNHELKQSFGMTPPKSGFFDYGKELEALRKVREEGGVLTIPEEKFKFYSEKQLDRAPLQDKTNTSSIIVDKSGVGTASDIKTPIHPDEEWGGIEDGADDDFNEAKEKVPTEGGYVYKVEDDKKPERKGWLWSK